MTSLSTVFVALAVIFLAITLRDVLITEQKTTPARTTWLRIALIFAVVAIVLHFVGRLAG